MPQKASPYHNPQHRNDLEKIALTKDGLQPEDLGLVPSSDTGSNPLTKPKDRRNKKVIEKEKEERLDKEQKRSNVPNNKFDPKGRPEDGRPKNSKDTFKRKQREDKPRTTVKSDFVSTSLWATDAQKKISDTINPALLAHFDKKNLRSLTKAEMSELEHLKLCILCNMQPFMDITADAINELLKIGIKPDPSISSSLAEIKNQFSTDNDRQPTIDEERQMQVSVYALSKTG